MTKTIATMLLMAGAALALPGCTSMPPPATEPQADFMARLTALCGKAFAGQLVSNDAADAEMADKPMVMHVRSCTADRIEIPFHIGGIGPDGGWDRSRTWIVTRTATGLRLKHDHRHADGSADVLTMYGGDTAAAGSAARQDFPVDAESIALFLANDRRVSTTNIWSVSVDAASYVYELRREGRRFRVAFDLTRPVAVPPAPWGW